MNLLLFRSRDMFLRRNIDCFDFFSDNMTFCWGFRTTVCYSVLFITIFQSFLLYISFIYLFWLPGWSNTCLINCCNDCSYSFSLFSSLSLQITSAEIIHIFIITLKICIYGNQLQCSVYCKERLYDYAKVMTERSKVLHL